MNKNKTVPTLEQIRELLVPFFSESAAMKAVVFGSYARREADEYSDLDLIIVAKTETPFLERFRDYTGIYKIWRGGLDMLIYTPDEVERMQNEENPFLARACPESIEGKGLRVMVVHLSRISALLGLERAAGPTQASGIRRSCSRAWARCHSRWRECAARA